MPNYAIMRTHKAKSLTEARAIERHDKGQGLTQEQKKNIFLLRTPAMAERTHKNYSEFFRDRTKHLDHIRKNGVRAIEVVLTFTPGAITTLDELKEWSRQNLKYLCDTYSEDNIYKCFVHLHESTPHIHAIITPIDDKGRLNASYWLDGREKLEQMQTTYSEYMQPFNLERGLKRTKKPKHQSIKDYIHALDITAEAQRREYEQQYTELTEQLKDEIQAHREHIAIAEANIEEARKENAGYRRAFGKANNSWSDAELTAYINGYADENNRIERAKTPSKDIDKGIAR